MPQDIPSSSRILIVGAGAMGLVAGYHLQLAGAEVTFLVRPPRVQALSGPQILYCYDDARLKHYTGYEVISCPGEARLNAYDYVIITIDGASSRSAEGVASLKELGDAIRDTSAIVISGGIGFELRKHLVETLGLAEERVLSGALGNLAHQVAPANLPAHPPTDPEMLAQAVVAYRHNNPFGFILEDRFPATAERFARLYDACGVSKCMVVDADVFELMTLTMFPMFAGFELLGWPSPAALPEDTAKWDLTVAAVQEVASLRTSEKIKDIAAAMTAGDSIVQRMTAYEADAMPLDLQAFHAFHHGNKVASQDLKLMQDCLMAGEREGKPMTSLKELLAKLDTSRRAAAGLQAPLSGTIPIR